jgi:hypothetical protein
MKYSLLLLLLMFGTAAIAQTEFTYPSLVVEYDSAVTFRNLKIIPIKRGEPVTTDTIIKQKKVITLKQGMQKGLVKVKERGNYMLDNINVLLIENNSGKDLFIKSGEIAMGGRQDRVFAKDTILSSGKKQYTIPVYCIEENRWSNHEKKFVYGGNTSSGLQKIIDTVHNQTKVWNEIRQLLKTNNQTSSSSYAAFINSKKIADTTNTYIQYFYRQLRSKDSSIVGIMTVTGNRVLGADVFVSTSLFYQTLGSLLEKYCTEAAISGSAPTIPHEKEKSYADEMLNPFTQPEFLNKKGKRFFYRGLLIQVTGY